MSENGWIQDMGGSDGSEILRVGAKGGEWSSVDDALDLNDQRVKGVDVERLARRQCRKVAFEQSDDSFPYSAIMRSIGWYKTPLQAFAS